MYNRVNGHQLEAKLRRLRRVRDEIIEDGGQVPFSLDDEIHDVLAALAELSYGQLAGA